MWVGYRYYLLDMGCVGWVQVVSVGYGLCGLGIGSICWIWAVWVGYR